MYEGPRLPEHALPAILTLLTCVDTGWIKVWDMCFGTWGTFRPGGCWRWVQGLDQTPLFLWNEIYSSIPSPQETVSFDDKDMCYSSLHPRYGVQSLAHSRYSIDISQKIKIKNKNGWCGRLASTNPLESAPSEHQEPIMSLSFLIWILMFAAADFCLPAGYLHLSRSVWVMTERKFWPSKEDENARKEITTPSVST